jgi:hypothetical protein
MEIILTANVEVGGFPYKKGDRLHVDGPTGRSLIADGWARPYPNMIEKIENQLGKIIKTKSK